MFDVSSSVADALGGGSTVNPDGSISAPSYNVGGTTVNNVGDAFANIDDRVSENTTNIENIAGDVTNIAGDITNITNNLNEGKIGLVQQDATTKDITVAKDLDGATVDFTGTDGERVLTGVAAGAVNASSVDAVNGSQLFGVSSSVADALGGGSSVNIDGSITLPSYNVGGTTVNNVGDAVTNIDGRVTDNTIGRESSRERVKNLAGDITIKKKNINKGKTDMLSKKENTKKIKSTKNRAVTTADSTDRT